MTELPRRRLLAVTGTAVTGALAGCASEDDEENGGDGEENGGDEADPGEAETGSVTDGDGTVLGEITVDNWADGTHTVDVIVEFDRVIEDWVTEELAPNTDVTLERNWPSDPGQLRVMARLDHGDPAQVTPANWNDPDCLNLYVRIGRDGELSFLSDTSGGPCSDP